MKCKFCGGNLSLEDEYCPHCGMVNEQARQHIRDMRRYKGDYEHTKKDVYEAARRHTRTTVQVVTIAILFITAVFLVIVGSKAYSLRRSLEQGRAERNAQSYCAYMEECLAEGNFMEFQAFCQEHYISGYDDPYEKYLPAIRVAQNYGWLYISILDAAYPGEYAQEAEVYAQRVTEYLEYFYGSLEFERYEYYDTIDWEINDKALTEMEENVRLMLTTYLGLSREEAESLKELSSARRAVLIEEAMLDEE